MLETDNEKQYLTASQKPSYNTGSVLIISAGDGRALSISSWYSASPAVWARGG